MRRQPVSRKVGDQDVWFVGDDPIFRHVAPHVHQPKNDPLFDPGIGFVVRLSDEDFRRVKKTFGIEKGFLRFCQTCKGSGDEFLLNFDTGSVGRWSKNWPLDDGFCDCQHQWNLRVGYHDAGIPARFFSHLFESEDQSLSFNGSKDLKGLAETYLANLETNRDNGTGLLVTGSPSEGREASGKSMVLFLIMKELVKKGFSCFSASAEQLTQMSVDGWTDDQAREDFEHLVLSRQYLFIDDLGKETTRFPVKGGDGLTNRTLQEVLRVRNDRNLVTFVSSDQKPLALSSAYPEAYGLIRDTCFPHETAGGGPRPRAMGMSQIGKMRNDVFQNLVQSGQSAPTGETYTRPALTIDGTTPSRKVV